MNLDDAKKRERLAREKSATKKQKPKSRRKKTGDPVNDWLGENLGVNVGGVEIEPYVDYNVFPPNVRGGGIRGRFAHGGSVMARGAKLGRTRPTKIR